MIPGGGVSALDAPGRAFADPDADAALFEAVTAGVAGSGVVLIETEQHLNDAGFARRAADELDALIRTGREKTGREKGN